MCKGRHIGALQNDRPGLRIIPAKLACRRDYFRLHQFNVHIVSHTLDDDFVELPVTLHSLNNDGNIARTNCLEMFWRQAFLTGG